MRLGIRRIAPNGLAQPVGAALRIACTPVGVAQVEVEVSVLRVKLDRLAEVVRRLPGLRRRGAPQLDHTKRVGHRRGRLQLQQVTQRPEGLVMPPEVDERQGGRIACLPMQARGLGHRHHRLEGGTVTPLVPQQRPVGQTSLRVGRRQIQRRLQVTLLFVDTIGGQAFNQRGKRRDRRRRHPRPRRRWGPCQQRGYATGGLEQRPQRARQRDLRRQCRG